MKILFNKICTWNVCLVIVISTLSCAINNKNQPAIQNTNEIHIEFYSKGAGIDFKSKKLLEEFVVKYNEEHKLNITYTLTKHGKEGETNFIFDLSSLKKKEKQRFKEAIKEQLKNASNYRIK